MTGPDRPAITVREATLADVDAIVALLVEVAARAAGSGPRPRWTRLGFRREGYLTRHYRRRSGELWDAVIMGLRLD